MEQLGKYQLIRKLATGGMAEVFLAKAAGPMGFQKTVVLKRILPFFADDPQFIDMFLAEARIAAQLNHPNVVQIFDFGQEGKTFYIAMEYIDGPNLRALYRRLKNYGLSIPLSHCAKVISAACDGLAYAHDFRDPDTGQALGLIHRDISPDNILLSRTGTVKVVDFGIAKASNQPHLTKSGVVKGKMAYMPPEQLSRRPMDRRVDVFALGVVFYQLVSGTMPFDATSEVSIIQALMSPEPLMPVRERRADVPDELGRIIGRALEKSPDDRYSSCKELQADIERFIQSTGAPVLPSDLANLVTQLEEAEAAAAGEAPTGAPPQDVESEASAARRRAAQMAETRGSANPTDRFRAVDGDDDVGETYVRPQSSAAVPAYDPARPGPFDRPGPPVPSPGAPDLLESTQQMQKSIRRNNTPLVVALGVALLLAAGAAYVALRGGSSGVTTTPLPVDSPQGTSAGSTAAQSGNPTAQSGNPTAQSGNPTAQSGSTTAQSGSTTAQSGNPGTPGDTHAGTDTAGKTEPGNTVATRTEPGSGDTTPDSGDSKNPDKGNTPRGKTHGLVEFRIRPYAEVYLDGKSLGQTPFPAVSVATGKHSVRMVNPALGKDTTVDFVVKARKDNVFKFNLKE